MTRNIFDIHHSILKSFEEEEQCLPTLEKRLHELQEFQTDCTNIEIQKRVHDEIEHLSQTIESIRAREKRYFYLLKTTPILDAYKREISKPVEINFMGEKNTIDTSTTHRLFREYIHAVRPIYPEIDIHMETTDKSKSCIQCSHLNERMIHATNTVACAHCGTEQDSLKFTFSYKDTDRVNLSSKYTYDRRLHFKECMNQLQGKQNSTIKPIVYEKLIEQLVLHGIVSADTSIPKEQRFATVKKSQLLLFLKEINFSNHYEDIHLIYHQLTGKPLDDISHLEQTLMNDFDTLSRLYDEEYIKTKKINRKNFINTQYVLFQLLKRHKYPCKKSDFTFLKTLERKNFHDEVCSHLFKLLGWNFTYMF